MKEWVSYMKFHMSTVTRRLDRVKCLFVGGGGGMLNLGLIGVCGGGGGSGSSAQTSLRLDDADFEPVEIYHLQGQARAQEWTVASVGTVGGGGVRQLCNGHCRWACQ